MFSGKRKVFPALLALVVMLAACGNNLLPSGEDIHHSTPPAPFVKGWPSTGPIRLWLEIVKNFILISPGNEF